MEMNNMNKIGIKILALLTIGVVAGRVSKKNHIVVTDRERNLLVDINSKNAICHKSVVVTVNGRELT